MAGQKRTISWLPSELSWRIRGLLVSLDCRMFLENTLQNRKIKPRQKTQNWKQKSLRLLKKGTDWETTLVPAFCLNGVNGPNARSVAMMGKMEVGPQPEPEKSLRGRSIMENLVVLWEETIRLNCAVGIWDAVSINVVTLCSDKILLILSFDFSLKPSTVPGANGQLGVIAISNVE